MIKFSLFKNKNFINSKFLNNIISINRYKNTYSLSINKNSLQYNTEKVFFTTNNNNKEDNTKNTDNDFEFNKEDDDRINSSKKILYIFAGSAIVILNIYFGLTFLNKKTNVEQIRKSGKVTYVGKANIGGNWELTDCETNKPYGSKDLFGKYYLIYFGFTKCPDVCPMSMKKIGYVLKELKSIPESKFFDIEAVFVSIDPDRDLLNTNNKIKRANQYCKLFDENIIAVSGKDNNDPELLKMLKDFKIHSSKILLNEEETVTDSETFKRNASNVYNAINNNSNIIKEENYTLDHTIVTYLMGTKNEFLTFLSSNLSDKEMKDIVLEEIKFDLNKRNIDKV